jgi:hypothetical protein
VRVRAGGGPVERDGRRAGPIGHRGLSSGRQRIGRRGHRRGAGGERHGPRRDRHLRRRQRRAGAPPDLRRQVRQRPRRSGRRRGLHRARRLRLRVRARQRRRRVPAGVPHAVPPPEARTVPRRARSQGGDARAALLRLARHHRAALQLRAEAHTLLAFPMHPRRDDDEAPRAYAHTTGLTNSFFFTSLDNMHIY